MEEVDMDTDTPYEAGKMLLEIPAVVAAALEAHRNQVEGITAQDREDIKILMNCMLDCVVKVESERSKLAWQIQSSETQAEQYRALVKGYRDNCGSAEDCALDFVVNQVHHPVISCFREITRADLNSICGDQLKKNATELEQALVCVGLLDYIATSLKNPLYGEVFCKSLNAVRSSVKRLFVEIKRILGDWETNSPDTFRHGKSGIMKYLRNLTPFFSLVQYDKPYSKALNLLDRVESRSQRHPKLNTTTMTTLDRPALSEIMSNKNPAELLSPPSDKMPKASQIDLTDESFDFLDDSPAPAKKTAPVFLKSKVKQVRIKKPMVTPTVRSPLPLQKSVEFTKRPPVEVIESETKRTCIEIAVQSTKIESTSPAAPKPAMDAGAKLNAFAFMMNRSKEIAKLDKLKKQLKSDNAVLKVKT